MEKLRLEIERKKQLLKSAAELSNNSSYVRQSDILKLREQEKQKEQEELDEINEKKRKAIEVVRDKEEPLVSPKIAKSEVDISNLSDNQIFEKLRSIREPVTLFGELASDRRNRLIALLTIINASQEEDRIVTGKGNDEEDDDDDDDEDDDDDDDDEDNKRLAKRRKSRGSSNNMESAEASAHSSSSAQAANGSSSSGPAAISADKSARDRGKAEDRGKGAKRVQFSKQPDLSKEKVIIKYFRSILSDWEDDLAARDEGVKLTARGRMETKTQKQCKDYIRPLFKQCKKKTVEPDILLALFDIVSCCEEGDFLKANDHYLRCAIGNSGMPHTLLFFLHVAHVVLISYCIFILWHTF